MISFWEHLELYAHYTYYTVYKQWISIYFDALIPSNKRWWDDDTAVEQLCNNLYMNYELIRLLCEQQ